MHLILTGATGLVGAGVLDAMIRTKDITKISILSRRPVPMADDAKDPRINVIQHSDFERYDQAVMDQLRGANGCVWALGVSQNDVTADEYVKITKDYTVAAVKAFATLKEDEDEKPFRFVFVSGEGATQNPGRFTAIFGRVKGETESALADLTAGELKGKVQADSMRPAMVDGTGHAAIKPYLASRGFVPALARVVAPTAGFVFRSFHSPTGFLGDGLTQMAMGRLDGKMEGQGTFRLRDSWIVQNLGLRRMMGI